MKLTLTYNPQYNRAQPDLGPELIETPVATQPRYYTGIGSRETPAPVLATMKAIAQHLAATGYTLRSGGARGADRVLECGAGYHAELYERFGVWSVAGRQQPRISQALQDEAERIAARLHPAWDAVPARKRPWLTRNPFQVTGATLNTPSAFVVYYAPEDADDAPIGGTRIAVLYARELGIPTFNLLHGTDAFKRYLREVTR